MSKRERWPERGDAYTQGKLGRARTELTRAVALSRDAGDLQMLAQASYVFGHVELAAGNVNAARDLFICSVDQFRALAIPWGTGSALTGLAWVALVTGDAEHAERLLDDATLVLRNAGPWFCLWCAIFVPFCGAAR